MRPIAQIARTQCRHLHTDAVRNTPAEIALVHAKLSRQHMAQQAEQIVARLTQQFLANQEIAHMQPSRSPK